MLAGRSVAAVRDALRVVAPRLADQPIVLPDLVGGDDPVWWSSSAAVGADHVAKFAWSPVAAERVAHEVRVLGALHAAGRVPYLPPVVAASTDPLLLVTGRVPGTPLFTVADRIDPDVAGRDLARFLTALHHPATRADVQRSTGELAGPRLPADTAVLRARFPRWVRADQRETVLRWCDWVDAVLAAPRPTVLVHADLHGDNQIWRDGRLAAVLDFETVCAAEPEYDLRALPGTGPGVRFLAATLRHYPGTLSVPRILAWHLRTACDDALWRSESGVPLPDHRTPADWVTDIAARLAAFDLT